MRQGACGGGSRSSTTFQKVQAWKSAARRLRQMGGTLPGVTTLMAAFDKILAAFNMKQSARQSVLPDGAQYDSHGGH